MNVALSAEATVSWVESADLCRCPLADVAAKCSPTRIFGGGDSTGGGGSSGKFADTSPTPLDLQPEQSSFGMTDEPCAAEAESKSGNAEGAAKGGGCAILGGSST